MTILRRVLWNIYAVPITLLVLGSYLQDVRQGRTPLFIHAVDFFISIPALVALHLHIWNTKVFVATFWKPYAFIFYVWDLGFNLLLEPAFSGQKFRPLSLIALVILMPLYVALFRYAFGKWKVNNQPD